MRPPSPDVARLAQRICAYLVAHPDAADDLEGVCRWWLADSAANAEEVRQALEVLAAGGLVESRCRADGTTIFTGSSTGRNM